MKQHFKKNLKNFKPKFKLGRMGKANKFPKINCQMIAGCIQKTNILSETSWIKMVVIKTSTHPCYPNKTTKQYSKML